MRSATITTSLLVLAIATKALSGSLRESRWTVENRQLSTPANTAAHRWRPGPGAGEVREISDGLLFECPFVSGVDRFFWDRAVALDLSEAHGIEIAYRVERPEAFRSVFLYAGSGEGWFVGALPAERAGFRRVRLPLARFSSEGSPVGWHAIDRIRLSPWSGRSMSGALVIESLSGYRATVAVVRPTISAPNAVERAYGGRVSVRVSEALDAVGLPYALLNDDSVVEGALVGLRLAILPYNPDPPEALLQALKDFVRSGGKLIVFYTLNQELGRLLGVRPGRYIKTDAPGRWHAMAFEPGIPGMPARVLQSSTRNIITAAPSAPDTRVIAWWEDASGRRRPEAAWLLSPNGAWMTHVLGADDSVAGRRMLLSLCEALSPGGLTARLAQDAVLAPVHRFDGARDIDAALSFLETTARRNGRELPSAARESILGAEHAARAALARGRYFDALDRSEILYRKLSEQYARAQMRPRPDEIRGVWDHSGYGLHAGDWESTARVLAEACITDLFLFVPNRVAAAYRVAPSPWDAALRFSAEQGIRTHAWIACWSLDWTDNDRKSTLRREGRLQMRADGTTTDWLCPTHADNRADVLAELGAVARWSGVAGLHLDYIRYPDANACYCPTCRQAFEKDNGQRVARWPGDVEHGSLATAWRRWRANQIDSFVTESVNALRTVGPDLLLSVAVFPEHARSVYSIGQNWAAWAEGSAAVDWIVPMNYTTNPAEFRRWVREQSALPGLKGRLVPGIGVTSSNSRLDGVDAVRQIVESRSLGTRGFVLFDLNPTVRHELMPLLPLLCEN